jgi:hypothetical protein
MSERHTAESVRPELLAEWLLVNGFAEEKRGYGHVSAEDLAEALLETFEIRLSAHKDLGDSGVRDPSGLGDGAK